MASNAQDGDYHSLSYYDDVEANPHHKELYHTDVYGDGYYEYSDDYYYDETEEWMDEYEDQESDRSISFLVVSTILFGAAVLYILWFLFKQPTKQEDARTQRLVSLTSNQKQKSDSTVSTGGSPEESPTYPKLTTSIVRKHTKPRFVDEKARALAATTVKKQKAKEASRTTKPKSKSKITLPEPSRFLPKVPSLVGEEPVLICQPVSRQTSTSGMDREEVLCLIEDVVVSNHALMDPSDMLDLIEDVLASTVTAENAPIISQQDIVRHLQQVLANTSGNRWSREEETEPLTPITGAVMPVASDGLTSFRHLPNLPKQKEAAITVERIAKEFLPIIRHRGYDVTTVSEFCCCGDGIDYEMGGHTRRVAKFAKIDGHDQKDCLGYNQTSYKYRGGRRANTVHSIHLRLRFPDNHSQLVHYSEVAKTMAHELAHCVHQNHKPEFYMLMQEIQDEHAVFVETEKLPEETAGVDLTGGFDVYGSSTTRTLV